MRPEQRLWHQGRSLRKDCWTQVSLSLNPTGKLQQGDVSPSVFPPCSVRGVRPPGAAPTPRINRVGRPSSRFVEHHGVHLHMLPLGKLHRSKQQRTWPRGEGRLGGGAPEQQSSGSLPGPAGRAGHQHPDTVPLHQQSFGALQLQHVRGHLLRDVHVQRHSGFCSAFQRVDGSERHRLSLHALWFGHHLCRSRFTPHFSRGFNYMEKEDRLMRWLSNFIILKMLKIVISPLLPPIYTIQAPLIMPNTWSEHLTRLSWNRFYGSYVIKILFSHHIICFDFCVSVSNKEASKCRWLLSRR